MMSIMYMNRSMNSTRDSIRQFILIQYVYDISNLVMTLKTLQTTNDDQTMCVLQFLDILDECVKLHDPQSPTVQKIRVLREHIIMTSESNGNIINHQIKTYD